MISPNDFIHPEDEAARRNMEAIPGFAASVKASLKLGLAQYYPGINMASKIRLSEKQLYDLYRKLPSICQKLGIAGPEFYLEINTAPDAYTHRFAKSNYDIFISYRQTGSFKIASLIAERLKNAG